MLLTGWAKRIWIWRPHLVLAGLLTVWLWWQGTHLDAYTFDFDEGVLLMQARLMAEGVHPYREMGLVFPPVWFWSAAAVFKVFGPSVLAGRLLSLAYAAVGGVSAALLGRRLAGEWGGVLALLFFTLGPELLWLSRAAMLEGPAISLCLLAFAVAAFADRRLWAWGVAGLAMGASLMVKALLPAGVVALLWLAWRIGKEARTRRAITLLAGILAPVVAVFLVYGPQDVWHYTVAFRDALRAVYPWNPAENVHFILVRGLWPSLGVTGAAALGFWFARRHPLAQALGILWVGSLFLLFTHTPLRPHHMAVLSATAAPLAAGGIPAIRPSTGHTRPQSRTLLLLLVLLGLQAVNAVRLAAPTYAANYKLDETKVRVAAFIAAHVPEGEYVVVDYPMIAFRAGRSIPPFLAEPSYARIASGYLTAEMAIRATQEADPPLIIFWSDRLKQLEGYRRWVETHYALVRFFGRTHPVYGRRP